MPVVGLGIQQTGDTYECERAVLEGIRSGYRMLDIAPGINETAAGRAIRNSSVAREDLFIVARLDQRYTGYVSAKRAFELSLCRLKLDFIDLFLVQPCDDIPGTWLAIEELHREGKVRAIGVSNFQADELADLVANSEIVPVINQVPIQSNNENRMQVRSSNLPLRLGREGIEFYGYSIVVSPKKSASVKRRAHPNRMGKLILTVRNSMHQFGHCMCTGSSRVTC